MDLPKVVIFAFSLFVSLGFSQTTTAPAGIPEQSPPTSTAYSISASYTSGFPCAGQALEQSTVAEYPSSLYTTTVTSSILVSTAYTCCIETYVRSDATPLPPTSTTYLNTVTSTSSLVCGGCDIISRLPGQVYPASPTYNATVTASETTEIEYTCTSRTLSVNTATYSGACTSISPGVSFPRDFQNACLKTIEGLSGCPYQCVLPIFTYPVAHCYPYDISHFWDYSDSNLPKIGCSQCLPPCPETTVISTATDSTVTAPPS